MSKNEIRNSKVEFERLLQIDAFRAIALCGLFLVHCVEYFELYWANPAPEPVLIFDAVFFLFSGKAFALFALSFGLSYSIIMQRAQMRGQNDHKTFVWRLIILLVIGFVHTAIYRGDILVLLAIFGLLLVPIGMVASNTVITVLSLLFLFNVPLFIRLFASYYGYGTSLQVLADVNAASMSVYMNGEVWATVWANLTSGNMTKWLFMLEAGRASQLLGMMLLGVVLGRLAFFSHLNKYKVQRRIMLLMTLIGSCLVWVFNDRIIGSFPLPPSDELNFYTSNFVGGWSKMLFAIFQTMLIFEIWFLLKGRFLVLLAPLGQMSLTFYVGQSLVFVPLLYNAGFGLYDDISVDGMFFLGVSCFFIQVLIARIWMTYFYQGPLEWGWRVLTHRTVELPFKR